MKRKLGKSECLNVEDYGMEIEPGVFEMFDTFTYFEDMDLCVKSREHWIWSVGKRLSDGKVFASTDARFYQNPDYECLWLR